MHVIPSIAFLPVFYPNPAYLIHWLPLTLVTYSLGKDWPPLQLCLLLWASVFQEKQDHDGGGCCRQNSLGIICKGVILESQASLFGKSHPRQNSKISQVTVHAHTPSPGRLRQENHESEASLGYVVRPPSQKHKIKTKP